MNEEILKLHYRDRGFSSDTADRAVEAVRGYERSLSSSAVSLEDSTVEDLKRYVAGLIAADRSSEEALLALARYCYLTGKDDVYVYFTAILGIGSILENIASRVEEVAGAEIRHRVFDDIDLPPPGSPPEAIPPVTCRMLARLAEELPPEVCRAALTGNAHGIPAAAFDGERARYIERGSIEAYLQDYHARKIDELRRHSDTGKVWYEQRITPEVVEFVKGEPEVLGGVRDGDRILVTKIPYDPARWLAESDSRLRRYYACHCPLARASILDPSGEVSSELCACSAGYEKLLFDAVFGVPVEVEVLESVLGGYDRCRFAVTIPTGAI